MVDCCYLITDAMVHCISLWLPHGNSEVSVFSIRIVEFIQRNWFVLISGIP